MRTVMVTPHKPSPPTISIFHLVMLDECRAEVTTRTIFRRMEAAVVRALHVNATWLWTVGGHGAVGHSGLLRLLKTPPLSVAGTHTTHNTRHALSREWMPQSKREEHGPWGLHRS